jgi:hypothetical protein
MLIALLTTSTPCTIDVRPCPTVVAAFSLQPRATMLPPTSAVISAPIPAPITPPGPLLIVECAIQRSLRPPAPTSDNAVPAASPLPVDRVLQVPKPSTPPPSLPVPAPPTFCTTTQRGATGHISCTWIADTPPPPNTNPTHVCSPTENGCGTRIADYRVNDAPPPPDDEDPHHPLASTLLRMRPALLNDCCRRGTTPAALPTPALHCHPRGCDEDASAPRAHPTCSTTPTPIPPAAPPHNNGAPETLGDHPPVATSLLLIVAATTHTSTPPVAPPHSTVAPAHHPRPRDRERHEPPSLLASQGHTTRCPIPPHANAGLILLGHVHRHSTYHHIPPRAIPLSCHPPPFRSPCTTLSSSPHPACTTDNSNLRLIVLFSLVIPSIIYINTTSCILYIFLSSPLHLTKARTVPDLTLVASI